MVTPSRGRSSSTTAFLPADKELPEPPAILTPLRNAQVSPFKSPTRSVFSPALSFSYPVRPKPIRAPFTRLLPAFVIGLVVALLGTILILCLTLIPSSGGLNKNNEHLVGQSSSAFFVRESSSGQSLMVSTLATYIVLFSTPFLLRTYSICTAGGWLSSQQGNSSEARESNYPTPLQYGLLFKLLGAPGVRATFDSVRYLWYKHKIKQTSTDMPRYFISTIVVSSIAVFLSVSICLGNIWLHVAVGVVNVETQTENPEPLTKLNSYGSVGWLSTSAPSLQRSLAIVSNRTFDMDHEIGVVTLQEGNMAIAVPTQVEDSTVFTAPSFGVSSSCLILTNLCVDAFGTFNCTKAGYSNLPSYMAEGRNVSVIAPRIFSSSNGVLSPKPMSYVSNPQAVVLQLVWEDNSYGKPNPILSVRSNISRIFSWASCDLRFYNVQIRHEGGPFQLANEGMLSDPDTSGLMMAPMMTQLFNANLHARMLPTLMSDSDKVTVQTSLEQQLSWHAVGAFAGSLTRAAVTSVNITTTEPFICYPYAPVVTFVSLLYLYACLAFGIFLWAHKYAFPPINLPGRKNGNVLALTQTRLTDLLTLVAVIFPTDGVHPMENDALKMFNEQTASRLEMGLDERHRRGAEPLFRVHKAHHRKPPRSEFEG